MEIFVIAEIGINHNGNLDIAKKLIDGAVFTGCDAVKFQKRTIEKVYTKEELDKPRESPWGATTREQKNGLEFGKKEYDEIDRYCNKKSIHWFASAWDLDSQLFLKQYNLKYNKIASPMLTNKPLLEIVTGEGKHTFISTGMSTMEEIEKAVNVFRKADCSFELMHSVASYPMKIEDANLKMIHVLRERFGCNIGYSGHEVGLIVSCAAAVLGATSIEKHITLDRSMYGSDQAASVEVMGMYKLVGYIRQIEASMGDGIKVVTEEERKLKCKLRKYE